MSLKPQAISPVPEETARIARSAYPKGNVYTWPTILQNIHPGAYYPRTRTNTKDDSDMGLSDLNALDECPQNISPSQPARLIEILLHLQSKIFQMTHDLLQFLLKHRLRSLVLELLFYLADPFSLPLQTGLKLTFVNEALRVAIN